MAQQSTFIEEMMAAGRGVIALLAGDRQAGQYFDFSQRGLVGSFIAILVISALEAIVPILLGIEHESVAQNMVSICLALGLQLGSVALLLRGLGRLDALMPFLVASNWLSFFVTLIASGVAAAGLWTLAPQIIVAIGGTIALVNIGRMIVTLTPLQIAMLIGVQLVSGLVALFLILSIFPIPPEMLQTVS